MQATVMLIFVGYWFILEILDDVKCPAFMKLSKLNKNNLPPYYFITKTFVFE